MVLHSFTGDTGGSNPVELVRDNACNLFGATVTGGNIACIDTDSANGCGTIFQIDPSGVHTIVHAFAGGANDGAGPWGNLLLDTNGNLYGDTEAGGAHGFGVLYKLAPNGALTVLHHFTGGVDGFAPSPSFFNATGDLFGTTAGSVFGCSADCGTIFRFDTDANLTTLYTFNGPDADGPDSHLVQDAAGNIYGTTAIGGSSPDCVRSDGCGTVFRLAPDGTFVALHHFAGGNGGGEVPTGSLVRDAAGNLLGTTIGGGTYLGGTVYRLDGVGDATNLREFVAADGAEETDDPGGQNPEGGVILGANGKLYGTTRAGGTTRLGVVFELDPQTGAFRTLHTFTPGVGGRSIAPLVQDASGDLYGTGFIGGSSACNPEPGCGIVFKIDMPN
jgi:uncharacterized repeat protein (TIGR03803 family)